MLYFIKLILRKIVEMIRHKGQFLQRGQGIGSIFGSLFRSVIPAAQFLGRAIMGSPVTKNVLDVAKKSAIQSGLQLAQDVLGGENVKESVKKGLGRVGGDIGENLKKSMVGSGRKRKITIKNTKTKKTCCKKKGKTMQDIFDY